MVDVTVFTGTTAIAGDSVSATIVITNTSGTAYVGGDPIKVTANGVVVYSGIAPAVGANSVKTIVTTIPTSSVGAYNACATLLPPNVYTVPGTYSLTIPEGVTSITVELIGGGGAGASGNGYCWETYPNPGSDYGGYGGNGGEAGQRVVQTIAVSPGQVYTVVVPDGGKPGNPPAGESCGYSSKVLNTLRLVIGCPGERGGYAYFQRNPLTATPYVNISASPGLGGTTGLFPAPGVALLASTKPFALKSPDGRASLYDGGKGGNGATGQYSNGPVAESAGSGQGGISIDGSSHVGGAAGTPGVGYGAGGAGGGGAGGWNAYAGLGGKGAPGRVTVTFN